jgi:two-component system phosphate regulon response regulator PhoB
MEELTPFPKINLDQKIKMSPKIKNKDESQRILLIEDEEDIRDLVEISLKKEGYKVVSAVLGKEGLELLENQNFDLVLLDWMLPDQSGIEVLRKIKSLQEKKYIPVIMVTAKTETEDVVMGLEAGADDYISKPFELEVLRVRVKAVLRRYSDITENKSDEINSSLDPKEIINLGELEINLPFYEVKCCGNLLDLTRSEFKMLVALAQNRGRVLTRTQLIDEVQGKGISVVDRAVDTHIFGLRKKLGKCSQLVETIRGVGYRVLP